MARALHQHLGIPAEVLLREPDVALDDLLADLNWRRFPVRAMAKLGWIRESPTLVKRAGTIIRRLIDQAGGPDTACVALYRKNDHMRANAKVDTYALRCRQRATRIRRR